MKKLFSIGLMLALGSAGSTYAQSYVDDRYSTESEKTSYSYSQENDDAYYTEDGASYIDYDDDSYTTRMRRFNAPMYGIGYWGSIYSPFYYDPFFMNPYYSWGGWYRPGFSISMGMGPYWSNCWGTSMWFGYGGFGWGYSPFMSPWGWGGYYGSMWGGGYGMGFWDGYYAGLYNGYGYYNNNRYHYNNGLNYGPRNTRTNFGSGRNGLMNRGVNNTPRVGLNGSKPGREMGSRNVRNLDNSVNLKQNPRVIDNNNSRNLNYNQSPRTIQSPDRNIRQQAPRNNTPRNIKTTPSRNYEQPNRNYNPPSRNFNSSPSRNMNSPSRNVGSPRRR